MKQCHEQHAECVKSRGMVEHLDFVSVRHLWSVAGPSGRLLGWHHRGQCPRLGKVSAPTCQPSTPVISTKLWTEPGRAHAALSTMQLGIRHIGINKQPGKIQVIWTFYLVQAFSPRYHRETVKNFEFSMFAVNFSPAYFIRCSFQCVKKVVVRLCNSLLRRTNPWKTFLSPTRGISSSEAYWL